MFNFMKKKRRRTTLDESDRILMEGTTQLRADLKDLLTTIEQHRATLHEVELNLAQLSTTKIGAN